MAQTKLGVALAAAVCISGCASAPSGNDSEGAAGALKADSPSDDDTLTPGTYARAGGFHLYVPGPCGAALSVLGDSSRDFAVALMTGADHMIATNHQSDARVRRCGAWSLERVNADVIHIRWKSSEADRGIDAATIAECRSPEGDYTLKSRFAERCPDPHNPSDAPAGEDQPFDWI
jgi:hypothetical protein